MPDVKFEGMGTGAEQRDGEEIAKTSMESERCAFNPMSDSWHWPENVADLQWSRKRLLSEQRPKKKRTHQKPQW